MQLHLFFLFKKTPILSRFSVTTTQHSKQLSHLGLRKGPTNPFGFLVYVILIITMSRGSSHST